jgi:hypothetical protein
VNIKRLIKNTKIKTNPEVNKAVLNDLLETLGKSKVAQPNILGMIVKSRMAKFAVAAVIIFAVCLFFAHHCLNRQIETPKIVQTPESKSSAELPLRISLNIAFRRGGMQAVEEQLAEADKKISKDSQEERITIEQILCELGQCG